MSDRVLFLAAEPDLSSAPTRWWLVVVKAVGCSSS